MAYRDGYDSEGVAIPGYEWSTPNKDQFYERSDDDWWDSYEDDGWMDSDRDPYSDYDNHSFLLDYDISDSDDNDGNCTICTNCLSPMNEHLH